VTGPLDGIRVIELGGIGPTPFAGLMLAELGADVVRIDRPGERNPLALAAGLRRSRPSIAVDLKSPAGGDVVKRLVDGADVLVEGFRPGVAERLGLGPEECLASNPRLVHARMTGWGRPGRGRSGPGTTSRMRRCRGRCTRSARRLARSPPCPSSVTSPAVRCTSSSGCSPP